MVEKGEVKEESPLDPNIELPIPPYKEVKPNLFATPIQIENRPYWYTDWNDGYERWVRGSQLDSFPKTPKQLIDCLNTLHKTQIRLIRIESDTMFVRFEGADYAIEQSGSFGAEEFLARATFTLTEIPGISFIHYNFEEGSHMVPGYYDRNSFGNYMLVIQDSLGKPAIRKNQVLQDELKRFNGSYQFTYVQSEYVERKLDFPVKVLIKDGEIKVIQEKDYVTGGDTVESSRIFIHRSGKVIISSFSSGRFADEIGGCSNYPIVDFERKLIIGC